MICSCIVHRQSNRWGNSDGSGKRIFKIKICMCQNNWAVSISSYIVRGAWTDMLMYFCHCIIISGKAYPNWKENCQVKLHSCHFLKRTCHNRIQRLLTWGQLIAIIDRKRKGCRWRFIQHFWDNTQSILDFIKGMSSQKASWRKSRFPRFADEHTTKCSWSSYFCKNNVHVIKAYIKVTLTHTTVLTFGSAMPVGCAKWWSLADDAEV